jgi:hypothetical protein
MGVFGVLFGAMISKCADSCSAGLADCAALCTLVWTMPVAGYGVQCRDDVHRSSLCIPGGLFMRTPGTADVRALFTLISVLLPFAELADHAGAVGACRSYGGDILPTHAVIVLRNPPIKYVLLGSRCTLWTLSFY